MRYDVGDRPISAAQLRQELRENGLEPPPAVHYNPAEGWVEVDSDSPVVPSLIAGHAPDARKMLPPRERELVDLIDMEEAGTLSPSERNRMERLVREHLRDRLLRGGQG